MTINFALENIENLKNLRQGQLEEFFSQLLSKLGAESYVALLSKDKSESLQILETLGFGKDKKTEKGASLLHYAASAGLIAAVVALLNLGYANTKTKIGAGLGHYAALNGHSTAIKAFVRMELFKLDDKDKNGAGFLLYAARNGQVEAISILIDMGLDGRETNEHGAGIIHHAVLGGNLAGMRKLIAQGFDPHVVDKNGMTSLHYAASFGRIEMISPLIEEYGLCPSTLNYANESIVDLAPNQKVKDLCNQQYQNYLSRSFQSENPDVCLREQKSFSM